MKGIVFGIGLALCMWPSLDWFAHPELTKMELFLKWLWLYLIGMGIMTIGTMIPDRRRRQG